MAKTNREKLKELQTTLEEIRGQAKQVEEKISNSRVFIDEIAQYKVNAEQWRGEIETAKDQSISSFNEIESLKKEIDESRENINKKLNAVDVKKEEVDKFFIKVFGEEDEQGKRSGGLKSRLTQKEKDADDFLNTQEEKYEQLFKKIESLLPGATSAGLAEAYYNQKSSYERPIRTWATFFIIALVGIIAIGLMSFQDAIGIEKAFSKIAARTPFYFALIWLATFSSKQYRQNKMLEQEYAHKEVLAKSYQGYKREFESQGKTAVDKEVLAGLNKVLIDAVAKNPSEMLDDGRSDDTPSVWNKSFNLFGKDKKE